jgi:hypothetical protein
MALKQPKPEMKTKSRHGAHRGELLAIRFLPEERQRIRDRAHSEGLPMSLWIRRLILLELSK